MTRWTVAAVCLLSVSTACTAPGASPGPTVATTTPGPASPASTPSVTPSSTPTAATSRSATPPRSSPTVAPPYIASAQWRQVDVGGGVRRASLQVRPTPAGRVAADPSDEGTAWAEVVALRPDADTPGMRDQFDCHWRFARLIEPDKPSWNLEPWRPVVDEQTMINTGCNPGGPEI